MPAKSGRQQRYAGMSRTKKGRAKLKKSGRKPMNRRAAKKYSRKPKGGY